MYSRSSFFSVVFIFDIVDQHRNSYLDTTNTMEWGKVKIWWDFGVMNPYFVLFCIAGVLCPSELGFDIFAFAQQCLTKKLEETLLIDSYSSYVLLFGFYTQQNVNSAAYFMFTSKIGLPRVVQVLWWVLFVRQIFVPPHSECKIWFCQSIWKWKHWSVSREIAPACLVMWIWQSLWQLNLWQIGHWHSTFFHTWPPTSRTSCARVSQVYWSSSSQRVIQDSQRAV